LADNEVARAQKFDELRKFYPERRGFHRYTVVNTALCAVSEYDTQKKPHSKLLAALGFCLS
jgi:hypothetical protein